MSSNFTLKQSLTLETRKAKKTKVALHMQQYTKEHNPSKENLKAIQEPSSVEIAKIV